MPTTKKCFSDRGRNTVCTTPVAKCQPLDSHLPQRVDRDGPERSVHRVGQTAPAFFVCSITASCANFLPCPSTADSSLHDVAVAGFVEDRATTTEFHQFLWYAIHDWNERWWLKDVFSAIVSPVNIQPIALRFLPVERDKWFGSSGGENNIVL